jgi:hypothetical protein
VSEREREKKKEHTPKQRTQEKKGGKRNTEIKERGVHRDICIYLKCSFALNYFTPQLEITGQAIQRMFKSSRSILFKDHMTDPRSSIPNEWGVKEKLR